MFRKRRTLKCTASCLLATMIFQLVYPNRALALSSGPSQPEVQGFEPVGTTDMVDLFSGDFVYNIPLLDVEGYPVNISYHGGVNMDQEASWVGLGWNINPGEINRTVRGVPDDFAGDSLKKVLHIKDEQNITIGANLNTEPFGAGPPIVNLSLSVGGNVNFSNYKGTSVNLTGGVNANVLGVVSTGMNVGVGSQTGAGIDYNASLNFSSPRILNSDIAAGVGLGYSSGYNTRTGLATRSFNVSAGVNVGGKSAIGSFGASIPIGMINNYVPVITNASEMKTHNAQIRVGGEAFGVFGCVGVNARVSTLHFDEDGSRKAYGYFNAQDASRYDILDFTREKDGAFNSSMAYLPLGSLTYDVYSVSGQGTGGSFRPLRNDAGSVFDPYTESESKDDSRTGEVGVGNAFSAGYDQNKTHTTITSGPWRSKQSYFSGPRINSVYEHVYFKQGGDLTPGPTSTSRAARSNLLYYFNGDEASRYGVASDTIVNSYVSSNGFSSGYPSSASKQKIARVDKGSVLGRKSYHVSEMVQVLPDGRRYVYGVAAMNNIQKEATFAIAHPNGGSDLAKGLVAYQPGTDDAKINPNGVDNYYSASYTPSYAHSYLLSSVLSVDYADVTGDGPSDDDFGNYTKFNYTRKETDYRWRAPIEEGKAQYAPGFVSDERDDKASYLIGSREQWMLHSIETKNFIAEFYTSPRLDGKGVKEAIDTEAFNVYPYNAALGNAGSSYKLDSIKLYNKHERFTDPTAAVPVKTVYFTYDYSLCKHIPNKDASAPADLGKLTLRKIFVKYGNSDKSLLSPYQFNYSSFNPDYNAANKDRWGGYKPNTGALSNSEYPFVDQASDSLDIYASAWSLQTIELPSGGTIQVDYESDDYAYVQDAPAKEMYHVEGCGMSRYYQPTNELFFRPAIPNYFTYFKRRPSKEDRSIPPSSRYASKGELICYNFSVSIVPDKYEPVKGYAEVEEAGICSNDTNYGYIKFKGANMKDFGKVNPVTYTSLNLGRYSLSHLVFPGSDPDKTDIGNILAGLFDGIKGLVQFMKNPLQRMMEEGKGKVFVPEKSFIRLASSSGHKKGGGQRVKSMKFFDNWSKLAGGNAQDATYGKDYAYEGGVASYEPLIGGDENPLRSPMPYKVQEGSNFPPSDPVELFQENPLGETFYPPASVGYSKITVSSIHRDVGRSSQAQDIYEYYTAKDYPVSAIPTGIKELSKERTFKFKRQSVKLEVEQSYSVYLNDMHGKMKHTEHRVMLPENGKFRVLNYQDYVYQPLGGAVKTLAFTGDGFVSADKVLGEQSDVTSDVREKVENTDNDAFFFSSNGFMAGIFPVYIPVPVPWSGNYRNEFRSLVTTSVTQRYGILKEVRSFDQGAATTMRNEVFDPYTGQAIVTTINNEFGDLEYTMSMPAWWAYKNMGAAYQNIGYTQHFDHLATVYDPDYPNSRFRFVKEEGLFRIGDEVMVKERGDSGRFFTAWVMPPDTNMNNYFYDHLSTPTLWNVCMGLTLRVRNAKNNYTASFAGGLNDVDIKVIRSGYKNQLQDRIQTVTALDPVLDATGVPKSRFTKIVNIKAQQYFDSLYARLGRPTVDSVNDYLNGNLGIFRLSSEHVYLANRNYAGSGVRKAGLFDANSFWQLTDNQSWDCKIIQVTNGSVELPRDLYPGSPLYMPSYREQFLRNLANMKRGHQRLLVPVSDKNWKTSRKVTKWTPWGQEAENVDALGNYSAALFRYNQQKPVAVVQNARQKEVLNDNFEDYKLLQVFFSWIPFQYSPFSDKFGALVQLPGSPYGALDVAGGSSYLAVIDTIAHTGKHCMFVKSGSGTYYPINTVVVDNSSSPLMEQGKVIGGKEYIFSYWFRPSTIVNGTTQYALPLYGVVSGATSSTVTRKSNIIEGWQQVEVRFKAPPAPATLSFNLPTSCFVDDIRVYPLDANMKSFVYHPYNQRLMATLDENNYATFYEYDAEGNLVRTKRETERGIITLTESRSANPLAPLH